MVNMYDLPALAKFVNTYVPINFDQLYRVGLGLKQAVDQAMSDLSGKVSKWSEFRSPSLVDTEQFYNKTIGALKDDITEFAANPDLLKTAEGRSRLLSKINNLDYSGLANIKLSALNLEERNKIIAEMKAKGLYNENWDDINVSQWNTLDPNQGIMNLLSPVQYKTMHDIAAPYSLALKPSYLGKKDAFHYWEGVDEKAIRNSINTHYADFINTPQGKYHMRDIAREMQAAGVEPTAENVLGEFVNRMVLSQKDYMNVKPVEDKVALELYVQRLKAKGLEQPSVAYSPRELLSASVRSGVELRMAESPVFGATYKAKMQELDKEDASAFNDIQLRAIKQQELAKAAQERGDSASADAHLNAYQKLYLHAIARKNYIDTLKYELLAQGFRKDLTEAYGTDVSKLNNLNVDKSQFNRAAVQLLDKYSVPITTEDTANTFGSLSPKSNIKLNNKTVEGYYSDSKGLILPQDLAADLTNIKTRPGISKKAGEYFGQASITKGGDDFVANWRAGAFANITYVPQTEATTYTNNNGKSVEMAKVKAYIPIESLYRAGYKKNIGVHSVRNLMERDLNAVIEKDEEGNEYAVIDTYKEMQRDPQTKYQFDRKASNEWYGTKTSDADRDYQLENAYRDIK